MSIAFLFMPVVDVDRIHRPEPHPVAVVSTQVWKDDRVLPNSWSLRGRPESILGDQAFQFQQQQKQ
jgi:hypothetical protein